MSWLAIVLLLLGILSIWKFVSPALRGELPSGTARVHAIVGDPTLKLAYRELYSPDPRIRLTAAQTLLAAGIEQIEGRIPTQKICIGAAREMLFGPHATEEQRVYALGRLERYLPPSDLASLLKIVLEKSPFRRVLLAAIEMAPRVPGLKDEEGLMMKVWAESSHAIVRVEAARRLGRIGTARSVEPLILVRDGLLSAPEIRLAAREAVERIQARLQSTDAGALSVASDGGELALEDGEGQLSL